MSSHAALHPMYAHTLSISVMDDAAARALMILVRDGTMYFFLIFLANLMNTLIFLVRDTI
jgi:hypothetical protein